MGASKTKYHRLGSILTKEIYFSQFEVRKSEIRVSACLGKGSFLVGRLLCLHIAEGARELCGIFHKSTNLIHEDSAS